MFRSKIFIFEKLNYFLLFIAIFLKILRKKIYFVRLDKSLQNKKSIKVLNLLGLTWLNFQDYTIGDSQLGEISKEGVVLQKKFGLLMDNLKIANFFNKKLEQKGCQKNDLKSFAFTKIALRSRELCITEKFLDFLRNDNKNSFVVVTQLPFFLKEPFKNKIEKKAKLLNFVSFSPFIFALKFVIKKLISKIIIKKNKQVNNTNSDKLNISKFETVFFPHQGIFFGDIYKKGQFYSKEKNSKFYHQNILHLNLAENGLRHSSKTEEFYVKNKITEINFSSLGNISFKDLFENLRIALKFFFFTKDSFGSILFFLNLWISIQRSLIRLNSLPNAKVAIFGYDLMSPRDVSIACRIKGIKTIATQERFLSVCEGDAFFIIDHYLIINEKVKDFISKVHLGSIKKMETIGPIRSDLISIKNYERKEDKDRIIMILDSHSSKNFYKSALNKFANWRQNYSFYEDIINLATKNKNFKFIIKGKNYEFLQIPYYNNIKNLINQNINIEIYDDKENSPYELIKKTSLTISRHTSLIDELLFREKPVIIYDAAGYPSTLFDYGKNLIVHNYDGLEKKFNLWKEDEIKFNENILKETLNYLPSNRLKISVYESLHSYLKKQFKYY